MQQYLIMAGASVLALGVTGFVSYNKGYENGENAVRVEWQEDTIIREATLDNAMEVISNLQKSTTKEAVVKYVDRVNTIRDLEVRNQEIIREVFTESPYVPEGWVYAHNQIVDEQPIDPELASNLAPSNHTFSDALLVVARNYGVAHRGEARDQAWNDFYTGVTDSYDSYELPAGTDTREGSSETPSTSSGVDDSITEAGENR